MRLAVEQATLAYAQGEVPIGAVVVSGSEVIGRGYNQVETLKDPSAHAEMTAIREATKALNNWRLTDCSIFVTLEPCTMCIGALRLARISNIIFGAGDSRFGALGSLYDLSQESRIGPVPQIEGGVLADECRKLMQRFFKERRK